MSDKPKYTKEDIQELKWYDHIRMRPGMYIGAINIKGFTELLKGIISVTIQNLGSDFFSVEILEKSKAKLKFKNLNGEIENNWGIYKQHTNTFILEFYALNALSEQFIISFWDNENNKIEAQYFEKGIKHTGREIVSINCKYIEVEFILDKEIWGESFELNTIYLTHHLREYAYLHKSTKFEILYKEAGEECKLVHHFKNGLKDRIDIEILNGIGTSYFETSIDTQIEDLHVEVAFAFRDYAVDTSYLKSYVNDYHTSENGSHIDGLLKGLTYGVMKYFQKHDLIQKYKISEKGMKENLVAAMNIKINAPVFSGCVKNKLANPEVIEPIANYVAELFFNKLEKEEKATERLIRKFEM